jgi:hypothetical protein
MLVCVQVLLCADNASVLQKGLHLLEELVSNNNKAMRQQLLKVCQGTDHALIHLQVPCW